MLWIPLKACDYVCKQVHTAKNVQCWLRRFSWTCEDFCEIVGLELKGVEGVSLSMGEGAVLGLEKQTYIMLGLFDFVFNIYRGLKLVSVLQLKMLLSNICMISIFLIKK